MGGDLDKAQMYYNAFDAEYTKVSMMMPEWKEYFPSKPMDDLGEAFENKDIEGIQMAMGQIGAVCSNCHADNMVGTWYKYSWKDFEDVIIEDPLGDQNLPW